MALLKTARASIVKPNTSQQEWITTVRGVSTPGKVASSNSYIRDYTSDKYLLSHATIVASVDLDDDLKNDRGWLYSVSDNCQKFINQNYDCWSRGLLLATYKTFIGAENYVEHVQKKELSKGKIIDAVARDTGDSIYIDILVATDRKHSDLIADIESGKMSTMSMGCTLQYSICTKCGNVAVDETEMCDHVRYEKGNVFYDTKGRKKIVAELCGHESDPTSNKFIEASWVKNPAFKGAVLRNIVSPPTDSTKTALEASDSLDELIRTAFGTVDSSIDFNSFRRVAASLKKRGFDFSDFGEEDEPTEESADPAPTVPETPKRPFQDTEDELAEVLERRVKDRIRKKIEEGDLDSEVGSENLNENLITSSFDKFKQKYGGMIPCMSQLKRLHDGLQIVHTSGWSSLSDKGFSRSEKVAMSAFMDKVSGNSILSKDHYYAIYKAGRRSDYTSDIKYLKKCASFLSGSKLTPPLAIEMVKKARILD